MAKLLFVSKDHKTTREASATERAIFNALGGNWSPRGCAVLMGDVVGQVAHQVLGGLVFEPTTKSAGARRRDRRMARRQVTHGIAVQAEFHASSPYLEGSKTYSAVNRDEMFAIAQRHARKGFNAAYKASRAVRVMK